MNKTESLLTLIALPLGSVLWLLLYGVGSLSQGAGAGVRALVYLAPLSASAFFALRLLRKDRLGSALMLIALTPLLSLINLVAFLALSGSATVGSVRQIVTAAGLFCVWQTGWAGTFVSRRRSSRRDIDGEKGS